MKPFIVTLFLIGAPLSLIFALFVGWREKREQEKYRCLHPELAARWQPEQGEEKFLEILHELNLTSEAERYQAWGKKYDRAVLFIGGFFVLLTIAAAYIYSIKQTTFQ